jgi:hypothetical protein
MKRIAPPPGWNKTTSELAASKPFPTPLEWEWAQVYELMGLRKWARFPRDGEVYEALENLLIEYLIQWDAPVSSGDTGLITRGTQVRVSVMPEDQEPLSVYADPLEYDRVERELIPEGTRATTKYAGFYLSIRTEDLNRFFRRISGGASR